MPLSEHEQKILRDIEQAYYRHDPDSAKRIGSTTLHKYLFRNCRWAAVAFLGGLIVLLTSFSSSWILGLVGFVIMTAAAVVIVKNIRRMGRPGWAPTAGSNSGPHLDLGRFRRDRDEN